MACGRKILATGLLTVGLILIIFSSIIFVGPALVPNATKSYEHIWGGETKLYIAKLEAGNWTVTVSSNPFWDLEIDIQVTAGNMLVPYTIAIAENSYTVTFTLTEPTAVHIRLIESSVYSDSSGFYSIQITGGEAANLPIPIVLPSFSLFLLVPFAFCISIVIITQVGVRRLKHTSETSHVTSTSTGDVMPSRTISSDIPDYRSPRLPSKCPNCGSNLSESNVDWVGPLEAICLHCEAVIKAKFERL
ncbi:MAG: hypothetical protein BAJATHORv1_10240 [Candidatus Thorarchaeota archaeon]|nr:MAG: hypothetical protein BAJATHORv1_10240 [Candidatus Thorarchaeota archaeon]